MDAPTPSPAVQTFERIAVGLLSLATGAVLVALALQGPLWLDQVRFGDGLATNRGSFRGIA